jgi:hypothetical protein
LGLTGDRIGPHAVSVDTVPDSAPAVSPASSVELAARLSAFLLFAVVPAVLLASFLAAAVGNDYAFDFRQFWQGGRDVLDGVSPYPSSVLLETASDGLGPHGIQEVFRFPYPAGAAFAMVPFAALPFDVAAALLTILLILATSVSLRLLGVRDWRCHGVAFASIVVLGAIRLGTFTPLLLLALAVAWRFRNRGRVAGAALAFAIVLKLFLWPVVVWLIATRRYAAALWAAGGAAGVTLLAWLVLGFDGLREYPELVGTLTEIVAQRGYSLASLGEAIGFGASVIPGLTAAGLAVLAARAARATDGDRRSFCLALLASLAFTPIVWLHYFMFLLIPIALWRPRLSAPWFLLLLFWLTPFQETGGDIWRIGLGIAITVAAFWPALAPARQFGLARRRVARGPA